MNSEGRVREVEEWEKDSLRALRHVKQEGWFTVLEKNAIVCADRDYAKLLRKLQEYSMSSEWRTRRLEMQYENQKVPDLFASQPVKRVAEEYKKRLESDFEVKAAIRQVNGASDPEGADDQCATVEGEKKRRRRGGKRWRGGH